jgi:hypothetical protein
VHDGDIAEELEAEAERGLDVVQVTFFSREFGWTLCEQLGADRTPREFEGLVWSKPPSSVQDGTLLRVAAHRFGDAVCDEVTLEWRSGYLYGRSTGLSAEAGRLMVSYVDGGNYETKLSFVEVGSRSSPYVRGEPRAAVVTKVVALGAAACQLVQIGFVVVDVGGFAAPTFESASELLADAKASEDEPLIVRLRRSAPGMLYRGAARKVCCARPPYPWPDDVAESVTKLLMNPVNSRRFKNVYVALKAEYEYALDENRRPKMPSAKAIESRMLAVYKKKKKQARDVAQNDAARCLARAARKAGVDNDDEDEVVSDDESTDGEEGAGDAAAAAAAAAASNSTEVDAAEVHYLQLKSVGVKRLRELLREERGDETELVQVKTSDLSDTDHRTRAATAFATLELLRRRLATVYTENDIVSSPPSPNDAMHID